MRKVEYKTPEELKKLTLRKMRETTLFLNKLKQNPPVHLDEKVHTLHHEAFSSFSCLECANCCKTIGPRLTHRDIERLANHLKIKVGEFYSRYVIADEDDDLVFAEHPCPFLLPDNRCEVYECRPKACREYPHTDRKRFIQILDLTHKNCETCPVVFEIMEELKQ